MKPSCLTIAGFDPSSGAGISADLRTFDRIGVFPFSVITAITYQSMRELYGYHPLSKEQIIRQIDAVLKNYPVKHVKIGMIPNADSLKVIVEKLKEYNLTAVLDPVTISSAGKRLSEINLEDQIREELLPLITVITPNLNEARLYSKMDIPSKQLNKDNVKKMGLKILEKMFDERNETEPLDTIKAVVIKSALETEHTMIDQAFIGTMVNQTIEREVVTHEKNKVKFEGNIHGTGCVFSSAIAAYLAQENSVKAAITFAEEFFNLHFQNYITFPDMGKTLDLSFPEEKVAIINQIKEIYNFISKIKNFSKLIPEVRMNISGALPDAKSKFDVAGIEGRITIINGYPQACGEIKYGVSDHTARLLLNAQQFDASIKFVMNLKYDPKLVELLLENTDLNLQEILRERQPEDIKSKEYSTMQWLIKESVEKMGKIPDIIWDKGSPGKEPMIRLFAKSGPDIILKLKKILGFVDSI